MGGADPNAERSTVSIGQHVAAGLFMYGVLIEVDQSEVLSRMEENG